MEWLRDDLEFQLFTELALVTGQDRPTSDQLAQYGRLLNVHGCASKENCPPLDMLDRAMNVDISMVPQDQTIFVLTIITYD